MRGIEELLAEFAVLRREDLMAWIAEEMVQPEGPPEAPGFSEQECGRVRLLCTLRYELDIETTALPVVMSLLDQLHDAQRRLNALAGAVAAQDRAVRETIIAVLQGGGTPG